MGYDLSIRNQCLYIVYLQLKSTAIGSVDLETMTNLGLGILFSVLSHYVIFVEQMTHQLLRTLDKVMLLNAFLVFSDCRMTKKRLYAC